MTARFEFLAWPQTMELAAAFAAADRPLRFVGGAVRDALLNRPVRDIDAATPALPEKILEILQSAGIRAIPTGIAHGTVTALVGNKPFEITTLRKDLATDGRHAQVAFVDDWQEDARRRDFTMNALYVSPQGELFDYFDGETDARAGRVRFIGDARRRVQEDYLRILRFFRFHAWYGGRQPDAQALAVCSEQAAHIDALSGERIQKEMLKLLASPEPLASLELMQKERVAAYVFGGDIDTALLARALRMDMGLEPLSRLALLLGARPERKQWLAQRWRLSGADAQFIAQLRHALAPDSPPNPLRELWRSYGERVFRQSVAISAAAAPQADPYCAMLLLPPPPPFPVSGKDLQALGMEGGPKLGETLRRLEQAWVESGYKLTKEQLLAGMTKT